METVKTTLKMFENKKIIKPTAIIGGDKGPIERDKIKVPKRD